MSRRLALAALEALPLTGLADGKRVCFGVQTFDSRLRGGLSVAALHEVYAASEGDAGAAAGFTLMLALRSNRAGPVVWLREDRMRREGRPYGLGVADLGHDPARLLLVHAPDTLALLRAGADAVACGAVAAVIIEPLGRAGIVTLTSTRRLAMAAGQSGVLTILLRQGEAMPSAAQSRWQVAAAPSIALAANAPGRPAFDISLLRHRSGIAGFEARLEWDRDRRSFAAPLSGAAPAAAAQRAGAPQLAERRAA